MSANVSRLMAGCMARRAAGEYRLGYTHLQPRHSTYSVGLTDARIESSVEGRDVVSYAHAYTIPSAHGQRAPVPYSTKIQCTHVLYNRDVV